MNWTILIIVGVLAIALVVFTIIRTLKDKKDLEQKLNNEYPKSNDEKGDFDEDVCNFK